MAKLFCKGSWMPLTSTHSGTLGKYTNGVLQVTLLLCKMRMILLTSFVHIWFCMPSYAGIPVPVLFLPV